MPVKRKLSRGRPRTRRRLSKKSRVRRRRRSRALNGGSAEEEVKQKRIKAFKIRYSELNKLDKETANKITEKFNFIYTHAKENSKSFPWAKEDKGTLLDLIFNTFFQWHYTEVDTLKSIITELKKIPNQDTNIKNLDFYSIQRNVNANLNISTNDQNFITNLLNNSK